MSKFISIREDIGGEFRRVAVNLDRVQEIRDDGDFLTFFFGPDNETVAVFDDDLIAALAAHGVVFEKPIAQAA